MLQDEYNSTQNNANILAVRDDEWPYVGAEDALAFTHLHFDTDTGELYDADIEVNSVIQRYSVSEPVNGADLDSVLTHEVGHLLGLSHTLVTDATMYASYTEGTDSLRTLTDDDVHGVCDLSARSRAEPNQLLTAPWVLGSVERTATAELGHQRRH